MVYFFVLINQIITVCSPMRLRDPDHLQYAITWPRWFLTYLSEVAFDVAVVTLPGGSRAFISVVHFVSLGPTALALIDG